MTPRVVRQEMEIVLFGVTGILRYQSQSHYFVHCPKLTLENDSSLDRAISLGQTRSINPLNRLIQKDSLWRRVDSPRTRFLLVGVRVLLMGLLIIAGPEYYVNQRIDSARTTQVEKAKQVDANRRNLTQLIGGLFVAIGLYLTYRRTQLTDHRIRVIEDGQVTDRFTQAIELSSTRKAGRQADPRPIRAINRYHR